MIVYRFYSVHLTFLLMFCDLVYSAFGVPQQRKSCHQGGATGLGQEVGRGAGDRPAATRGSVDLLRASKKCMLMVVLMYLRKMFAFLGGSRALQEVHIDG